MANTIRVAQVVGKMVGGGVESVVMNYYRNIDKDKIQFDFFVHDNSPNIPKDEIESMGGRVFLIPPYNKINDYISTLIKLFKKEKYKIVHSHMNTLSVFSMYAAKRAGVPVRIAHNHSTAGKGETKKNIMKYILRPMGGLFPTDLAACTEFAGEWMWGKKVLQSGKITIFNNAIDLNHFKANKAVRDVYREKFGLQDKFVIGHVGRFCYQKNQEFLVDIFNEVHKTRPDAVLMLIGEGETVDMIKGKVSELGLDNSVKFMGSSTEVYNLYQAMDVFVLPSRYEGLGMVAIEAQAMGIPTIVSTEVPKEACVTDGIEFIDLDAGAEMWAEKIAGIDLNKTITDICLKEKYDITEQADKLRKYYERLYEQI
jgi:glycosyltransferase EpsF